MADEQAPSSPVGIRVGFRIWAMVLLGVALLIALIALFGLPDLPDTRPWAWVFKLLIIVLALYGWWKARQGRKESKGVRTD